MSRITIGDFKNQLGVNETFDIVNAIRNSASPQYQQYVPLANAENVAAVGAGLLQSQTLQNEFVTSLVDRIALVVIRNVTLSNDFKRFKKGDIEFGRKIEEIYTDIAEEQLYDPEDAEETVFKRVPPDVKVLFHERNRQARYKQTIQDSSLKSAFLSWGNFEGFLSSIINAMYNANEVDEYKYSKLLIDNYYSKGLFKNVVIDAPDTETTTRDFIKKARMMFTKLTLGNGSRENNAMGVHTRSMPENIHLFITPELEANVDVDVLSRAFNMNKTDFLGKVTVIDNFANPNIQAVMVDSGWFMIYDNLFKMETIRNPQGLYWNYNLHVWQTYSASRFHNAVAFVTDPQQDVPPVTQVIVNPIIEQIRKGSSKEFTAIVRRTVGVDQSDVTEVEWSLEDSVDDQSSVDSKGVVTVGDQETATQLTVKATVTYPNPKYVEPEDGEEPTEPQTIEVSGTSTIVVMPAKQA